MNKYVPIISAFAVGMFLGGVGGFSVGVVSTDFGKKIVRELNSVEEQAKITTPKTITRKGFTLNHPANWAVDTSMDDYDPDTYFDINSPGGSWVMFMIYDFESVPKEDTESQVENYKNYVGKATKTTFQRWGKYTGYGVELKGKLSGITPGRVRIFTYSNALKSFTVIEQQYDADARKTQPGLNLIESTFNLK